MQKRAYKRKEGQYESFFAPLPVGRDELIYCDKKAVGLPYAENFPKLHYHDRFEIGICIEGEGLFLSEGEFFAVSPGDLIFIAPGRRHYSRSLFSHQLCRCRFAYIGSDALYFLLGCNSEGEKARNAELCARIPAVLSVETSLCARELSDALSLCEQNVQNMGRIVALKLATFILRAQYELDMSKAVARIGSFENLVSGAAEYISLHYMESDTSAKLAELCHLSESQLRRSFSAAYGMPPIAYRNRLRCLVAAELLQKSRMTAGQIADKVGYGSTSDFYRAFKKFSGVSPSEYRKGEQNGAV